MRLTSLQKERLLDTAVREVLRLIEEKGGQARVVGGAVRDCLLGREIRERDIATTLSPDEVTGLFGSAGCKVVPTGIAFGTVTVVFEGTPFEITTLRRDVETDGRHAIVSFSDDWAQDAARRDFTINALSVDRAGELYDYTEGLEDLKAGRLRFIGEARLRLDEDRLRLLRLFRFWATLEDFSPDETELLAAEEAAAFLSSLSAERITQELRKLFVGNNALVALRVMIERRILSRILESPPDLPAFETYCKMEAQAELSLGWVRRLAILFPQAEKEAVSKLCLTKKERGAFALLTKARKEDLLSPHIMAYRYGLETALTLSLCLGRAAEARALALWTVPSFPLQGRDLVAHGIREGAGLGQILKETERWWEGQAFAPTKAACLEKALQLNERLSDTSRSV